MKNRTQRHAPRRAVCAGRNTRPEGDPRREFITAVAAAQVITETDLTRQMALAYIEQADSSGIDTVVLAESMVLAAAALLSARDHDEIALDLAEVVASIGSPAHG
ncbi:UNVERIFIED_ORG: hypothetical protein GGD51_002523 [Rhizobium esperanzae]